MSSPYFTRSPVLLNSAMEMRTSVSAPSNPTPSSLFSGSSARYMDSPFCKRGPISATYCSTEWTRMRFKRSSSRMRRGFPSTAAADALLAWFAGSRVAAMLPRYLRFVAHFPSLETLAAAPIDEVLALFSGLGYYARARNLHAAAKAAVALGGLPRSSARLRNLPGFGPYTAAAVASLAFGEQVALVDGNVARVFARLLRIPGTAEEVRAKAWAIAPSFLPA